MMALATERRAAIHALEEQLQTERMSLDARVKDQRLKQIVIVEEQFKCESI
jgi:hypothetical protein